MKRRTNGYAMLSLVAAIAIIAVLYMFMFAPVKDSDAKDSDKKTKEPEGMERPKGVNAQLRTLEKAKGTDDLSKIRNLQTAITTFEMDNNRIPKSLDELVEKGYAEEGFILDHSGKKFTYKNGKVSK